MWPFRKTSPADRALAVMPEVIDAACEKWRSLSSFVVYKDGVSLADRIGSFMIPFEGWLYSRYPVFEQAPGLALLIVAKGVEKSGTHSKAEIEEALGVQLPD